MHESLHYTHRSNEREFKGYQPYAFRDMGPEYLLEITVDG
jgi:hypothetical protein